MNKRKRRATDTHADPFAREILNSLNFRTHNQRKGWHAYHLRQNLELRSTPDSGKHRADRHNELNITANKRLNSGPCATYYDKFYLQSFSFENAFGLSDVCGKILDVDGWIRDSDWNSIELPAVESGKK